MSAAEKRAAAFESVSADGAATVRASRCQHVNRTFEAIEYMRLAAERDRKRLVVIVAAVLASCHRRFPSRGLASGRLSAHHLEDRTGDKGGVRVRRQKYIRRRELFRLRGTPHGI